MMCRPIRATANLPPRTYKQSNFHSGKDVSLKAGVHPLRKRTRRNGFMCPGESGQLTAELCDTKAKECLYLAQHAASQSQRIMLEHIAETWYRIADRLPANDA